MGNTIDPGSGRAPAVGGCAVDGPGSHAARGYIRQRGLLFTVSMAGGLIRALNGEPIQYV